MPCIVQAAPSLFGGSFSGCCPCCTLYSEVLSLASACWYHFLFQSSTKSCRPVSCPAVSVLGHISLCFLTFVGSSCSLRAAQGCLAGFIFDVCILFRYNSVAVGLDLHPGARLGPYCFGGLLGCVQCGAQHMQCSKRTYGSCQGPMILASKTICLQLCGYLNA
jgi:hypothetical protein